MGRRARTLCDYQPETGPNRTQFATITGNARLRPRGSLPTLFTCKQLTFAGYPGHSPTMTREELAHQPRSAARSASKPG